MTKAHPLAALALVVLALTGCSAPDSTIEGTIVHKEYIPASVQEIADVCNGYACSGGGQTLERQCWRIDVEKPEPDHQGLTYTTHYCVFPSEFNTLNVGDKYTAPKIAY